MGYPLYGLVLAGGKSTRMGEDKSLIAYFGLEHRIYLAKMIAPFCEKTYISCQEDQLSENLFSIDYVRDKSLKNEVNRTKNQQKNLLSPIYVYEALNKAVSQIKNCKFIDKLSIFINNDLIINSNDQSRKNEDVLTFLNCLELKYTVGFPLNLIINQKFTTLLKFKRKYSIINNLDLMIGR